MSSNINHASNVAVKGDVPDMSRHQASPGSSKAPATRGDDSRAHDVVGAVKDVGSSSHMAANVPTPKGNADLAHSNQSKHENEYQGTKPLHSGDGTFGDGKFDAAAPGAGHKASEMEAKARQHLGEGARVNIPVNLTYPP